MNKKEYKLIFLSVFFVLLFTCVSGFSQEDEALSLKDGVYEAGNRMLDVLVTIEGGAITDIEILEHRGGGEKYEKMILPLIDTIIET